MRLLIVTYYYAPDIAPRAFRWTTIAERWTRLGHDVHVVAAWKPGQARAETRNGVSVERVGGGLFETARVNLGASDRATAASGLRSVLGRLVRAVYTATWRRLYWPDFAALWRRPALSRARRILASERIDGLVTVSHPFTSHLVGLALKRELPRLRWLVDIGDPFSFFHEIPINNRALYARRNTRAEGEVLAAADGIAVTLEAARTAYAQAFPHSAVKMGIVPPLMPEVALTTPVPANDKLRLVYSGTLYRAIRDPDYLLRLFAGLNAREPRAELHLFGQVHDCAESFAPYRDRIDRSIFLHGPVAHERALTEMGRAAALVNIGNRTAYQVPSKIIEYMAVGRPILNLAADADDSSTEFLAGYPDALTLVTGITPPDDATITRVATWLARPPSISEEARAGLLRPYTADAIAAAYLDLVRGPAA
ncbi:MAG: hypothetical protein HY246_02980 [Proteobacteria bacterium]|nr:hypothetical protein [Pseudomonadota bacterium]